MIWEGWGVVYMEKKVYLCRLKFDLINMQVEGVDKLLALLNEYKELGIAKQIDYDKFYLYSLITHSTAIEGSTITEIENQLLFDEGITAKGRSLQEQMMNIDLKKAYEKAQQWAKEHVDFSIEMLRELSGCVMKNTGAVYNTAQGVFDSSKGDLRLVGVTAGVGGRSYMNYQKVPMKLAELCDALNQRRRDLLNTDDIIAKYMLSFDIHFRLVTIHPWVDGNGRMARLVMNMLQYEFGLILSKIQKEDKVEYIQALIDSREAETLEPIREFLLRVHIKNLAHEIAEYKKSQEDDPINYVCDPIKVTYDPIKCVIDTKEKEVYDLVLEDNSLTYAEYATRLGVSDVTIKRRLSALKEKGIIRRQGSNKKGFWEIIKRI